jgi:hexosaminidase
MTRFRLDSDWTGTHNAPNRLTFTLTNLGDTAISDFKLAYTSLVRIKIDSEVHNGKVVDQVANYHVIEPPAGFVLEPGKTWNFWADQLSHQVVHYSYGPKSAALYLADGAVETITTTNATANGEAGAPEIAPPARGTLPANTAPISVIPWPALISVSGSRPAPECLSFGAGPSSAKHAFETVAALAGRLFPEDKLFGDNGLAVRTETADTLEDEGYVIDFGPHSVVVRAGTPKGFRNAFITLGQILRGARAHPEDFTFPASGTIGDTPRFGFRGAHLDVARQVYETPEVIKFIDTMAWNKLNRFHFHLNDDEGWRFAVPDYPELAEIAAFRGPGLPVPPLFGSPFTKYGFIYTPENIAGIVTHAAAFGIDVIPEIDIPGHCYTVLQAIPALRDPDETGIYRAVQYYPNNALNPALEKTYEFLTAVFKTVVKLFPSPWIHIGGDEVSDKAWTNSPLAKKLMAENGWTDTFQLQSYFLKRVQQIVRDLGRKTGAWEEAAFGGGVDAKDSYLVVWTKSEPGRELAEAGYDIVMAPAEHVYFDMGQSEDWWDPGASWAGNVSVEKCYAFDPGHDWPEAAKTHLIGVQSCLWSENLHDKRLFDHLMYPRLSAMAETAWSQRGTKNFARFMAIQSLMPVTGIK